MEEPLWFLSVIFFPTVNCWIYYWSPPSIWWLSKKPKLRYIIAYLPPVGQVGLKRWTQLFLVTSF